MSFGWSAVIGALLLMVAYVAIVNQTSQFAKQRGKCIHCYAPTSHQSNTSWLLRLLGIPGHNCCSLCQPRQHPSLRYWVKQKLAR